MASPHISMRLAPDAALGKVKFLSEARRKGHSQLTELSRSERGAMKAKVASLIAAGWMGSHPVLAQQNIVNPAQVQPGLMQGPALYKAHCAVCHGNGGQGDGPMAASLKAKVPDLTHIAMRNGGRFPVQRVQKIILGEAQAGITHGTREMPVWGPVFSEVTRDRDIGRVRVYNLAKYLEEIQKD